MLNCQQAGKLARSVTSGQPRQRLSRRRAPLRLCVALALLSASVPLRINPVRKEKKEQKKRMLPLSADCEGSIYTL